MDTNWDPHALYDDHGKLVIDPLDVEMHAKVAATPNLSSEIIPKHVQSVLLLETMRTYSMTHCKEHARSFMGKHFTWTQAIGDRNSCLYQFYPKSMVFKNAEDSRNIYVWIGIGCCTDCYRYCDGVQIHFLDDGFCLGWSSQHVRRQSSCYSEYYHPIVTVEEKDPCVRSDQGDFLQSHPVYALPVNIDCGRCIDETIGRNSTQTFD
jgi:hypothetical protein